MDNWFDLIDKKLCELKNFCISSGDLSEISSFLYYTGNLHELAEHTKGDPRMEASKYAIMQLYLALDAWRYGNIEKCKCHALKMRETPIRSDCHDFDGIRNYTKYLQGVITFGADESISRDIQPIYFIGDSHSVSGGNQLYTIDGTKYRGESICIVGAKAFNLSKPEFSKYNISFYANIKRIAKGSKVIVCLGEIDCRPDFGIIPHCKKYKKNTIKVIKEMVPNYVKEVVRICSVNDITPIFWGVPEPKGKLEKQSNDDWDLQRRVIQRFNNVLKKECEAKELRFIDIYNHTINRDVIDQYHFDQVHLKPKVYQELLSN